jgi:hypothetical protein
MKKIVLSLLALAATMNIMAVTYSAKATITLESTDSYESCEMIIGESNQLVAGLNNGEYAEINMEGRSVALYVEYEGVKYQHFASAPATMKNLTLGAMTDDATSYNLIISDVTGSFTIKLGDAEPFAVAEGTTVITLTPGQTAAIGVINYEPAPQPTCDYHRDGLVVGRYYTICLPNAVELPEGASFWNLQYRNAEGSLAYLVEAELPLVAGRPYIFQAEATELCLEYSGNPVNGPSAYGALQGTFEDLDQSDLDAAANDVNSAIYLLFNNALWLASDQSENIVGANRAYIVYEAFEVSVPNPAPGRRVRAVPMQTNGTTAIENLKVSDKPVKLMKDGQIFILRGENLYDATGRMVK